jgi:hypothetical protein
VRQAVQLEEAISAVKQSLEQPVQPVPAAIKTVVKAMQADPDYAWGWHCNIAMAFVDAGGDHYTGNQGAARFMKMLADVEPAHELPSPPPPAAQPATEESSAVQSAPVQEPVACQHKKPICDSQGKTLGYSDWKDGKGLAWWPHRSLYTTPPAAQRQWVDMPELQLMGAYEDEQQGRWGDHVRGLLNVQAKLKELNA